MKRLGFLAAAVLMFLTACGVLSARKLVLPEAKDLDSITITANQLVLTVTDSGTIARLLALLRQSAEGNTGKPSVQDIPDKGAGLMRLDFGFRAGSTGTAFLYREDTGLFLEQPYRGIYGMDVSLEEELRLLIALELARQ